MSMSLNSDCMRNLRPEIVTFRSDSECHACAEPHEYAERPREACLTRPGHTPFSRGNLAKAKHFGVEPAASFDFAGFGSAAAAVPWLHLFFCVRVDGCMHDII